MQTEFHLIRHAALPPGTGLTGRGDPEVSAPPPAGWRPDRLLISPARRARITAAGLFPDVAAEADPRLWEQDFGAWEGRALDTLPDLGPLSGAELAAHRPPGGESFADLCARLAPALQAAATGGRVAIVAHAGTVRGALALALASPAAALAFEVAPLSSTGLRAVGVGAGRSWAIRWVNRGA